MFTWTLLVNLTLKSTLVLALAWIAAFALRRRSAAARHIVWTAAAAALLALPVMSVSLPAWHHPLANAILPADTGLTFHATATAPNHGAAPAAPAIASRTTGVGRGPAFDLRRTLVLVWTAGAALALLHMLFAYVSIWRLRRGARRSTHDGAVPGIPGNVAILETAHAMPMTAGILRPAIFLPTDAASWTPDRLRLVLLHEWAHVLRGDAATQLLARTALSLQWFNPLAWMAWREFLKERERAADDLVLQTGAVASDYAGHLLEVARTMQAAPAAAAGVAMARRSQLEGRLLAILDSRVRRAHPGRAAIVTAVLAALLFTSPLATIRAQSQADQQVPPDLMVTLRVMVAEKNDAMLEQTAVAYEKLNKLAEAQKLREAALAVRKESGENSPRYAEGLVKLGDLAQQRGQHAEAVEFYKKAVAIGDMPETFRALIQLGLDAYRTKDTPGGLAQAALDGLRGRDMATAKDYLERARNAAKTGDDMGIAMTWLAYTEQDESLYRAALSVETPDSRVQAMTLELLARFLRNANRPDEAEPLEARARTLRTANNHRSPSVAVQAYKVGQGVTAPKLLYKVEPSYSEEARVAKLAGTVLLKITIDVDGVAKDAQLMKSIGLGLDEKAIEAVQQWKFKPGELNGVPVPVMASIEINFKLL